MNEYLLYRLADAILRRGDPRWATPSGSFLDGLREAARGGEIRLIAAACSVYFSQYPVARHFVAAAVPGILINAYKPLTCGISFRTFLTWARENPEWRQTIRDCASSPSLVTVVNNVRESIQDFARRTQGA